MKSWIWLFGSDRSSGNANVCLSGTSLSKALHLISLAQIVKLKDSALSQISLSLLSAYRAEQMEPKSTSSFCNSIQCYCYFFVCTTRKIQRDHLHTAKGNFFQFYNTKDISTFSTATYHRLTIPTTPAWNDTPHIKRVNTSGTNKHNTISSS